MPLTAGEQIDLAMRSVTTGDIDLLATMLSDPDTVTLDEQRTVAEKLGLKRGLLSAMVNTFSDPVVWLTYLMSRAFPTTAFLKGTVPKSFVGAAQEFTGISMAVRPVEGFFRGTNVSKLTALAQRRHMEAMKVGNQIFEATLTRPNWAKEKEIVSLLMENYPHAGATPELRQLAGQLRGHMNSMWGMLNKAQRVEGGFDGLEIGKATAVSYPRTQGPRWLRDYLPHIPLTVNESVMEMSGERALRRMARGSAAQTLQLKKENLKHVWSVDAADQLSSDFTRYQSFMQRTGKEVFNRHLLPRSRRDIPLQSAMGDNLFVTDLDQVFQKYVHSVAKTYATNVPLSEFERFLVSTPGHRAPTREPIVVQVINEGLDASLRPGRGYMQKQIKGTQHVRESLAPDSFNAPMVEALRVQVRSLQGRADLGEAYWGGLFNRVRYEAARRMGNLVSNKKLTEVSNGISTVERNGSFRNRADQVSSYFYASTLGLNGWSAFQNLLQPFLTTIPAIGIGPTMAGYREMGRRLPRYASEVLQQHRALGGAATIRQLHPASRTLGRMNEAAERAYFKVFPELRDLGFKIDPRLFEVSEASLKAGKFRSVDEWFKFILQPFTHSELSNQVVSFFGAKQALRNAMRTGEYSLPKALSAAQSEQALNFEAGMVVNATQFRPGPGSRTWLQSMLPSPLRQFTSFPVRLLNFFSESTVRGAMTEQQLASSRILRDLNPLELLPGMGAPSQATRLAAQKLFSFGTGRNLGTVARTLLVSRMVTNGMRDVLGIDVARSLGLTAPFANIAPDSTFGIIPTPPIASAVKSLLSYASTRDVKSMQPMVLPGVGEIQIPKTLVPGGLAVSRAVAAVRQYRPDMGGFVDDNERLMYQGGTTDLILSMLGIPLEKGRRMRDGMDKLYANRRAIRDFRRRYAVATMNSDFGEMDGLQGRWAKAFPDMPPLTLSHRDLQRYRDSARLPLLSRMIRTMGRGSRYLERDIYTYDPDLVAPPALDLAG